jgi:hypothetical protein
LGNDVWTGTGQTYSDGPGEAHYRYTLILKAFVGAVLHLGLPGYGLCISSCITNSLEGESTVSRRQTDDTMTDLGLILWGGGASD